MTLECITAGLREELRKLEFHPPVAVVYNPLEYAWRPHVEYLRRFGEGRREIVMIGMNPGPWGMVQTGVPFGDVAMVRDWLAITGPVSAPDRQHVRRPVSGFSCRRSEISGTRLWGWARDCFGKPEKFFARFFVVNYCPLCFFDEDGANRTPDRLAAADRDALFAVCDRALMKVIRSLQPRLVLGIGRFAERRAREALQETGVAVAGVLHPSGANPLAGRDWGGKTTASLRSLGVRIP